MENEIWLPVKNFEDRYEVSNKGRVRSLDEIRVNPNNGSTASFKGRIIKPMFSHRKYYQCNFWRKGKNTTLKIHRVVAAAFLPNPNGYDQVNHIDGCKTNNLVENLEWCSGRGNIDHAMKMGLTPKGQDMPLAKLKNEDVLRIRELHADSKRLSRCPSGIINSLATQFGVSYSAISQIVGRRSWKHI